MLKFDGGPANSVLLLEVTMIQRLIAWKARLSGLVRRGVAGCGGEGTGARSVAGGAREALATTHHQLCHPLTTSLEDD